MNIDVMNMQLNLNSSPSRPAGSTRPNDISTPAQKDLMAASKEVEAMFLNQLLAAMRKTLKSDSLMDGGQAEKMFSGMLDSEYSSMASKHGGGYGIADMIYKQLERSLGTVRPGEMQDDSEMKTQTVDLQA